MTVLWCNAHQNINDIHHRVRKKNPFIGKNETQNRQIGTCEKRKVVKPDLILYYREGEKKERKKNSIGKEIDIKSKGVE